MRTAFNALAFVLGVSVALAAKVAETGKRHKVMVGMNSDGTPGLSYSPSNTAAKVGDIVQFVYTGKNHSVTQSSFAAPCSLLANDTTKSIGFDSGFVAIAAEAKELSAWELLVEVETPIWFYCAQGNHCSQGMVGSINAVENSPKSFEEYKKIALAVSQPAPEAAPAAGESLKSSSKDAAKALVHNILVGMTDDGKPGLSFSPANITAAVGDVVNFIYTGKNHSVTQSTFGAPCSLASNESVKAVGFDSGFVPSPPNSTDLPTWSFTVESETPIWFYCAQGNHCSQGMVGSVNAVESGPKNFAAYKATAMAVKQDAPAAAAPAGGEAPAAGGADGAAGAEAAGSAAASSNGGTAADQSQSGTSGALANAHIPHVAVALVSVFVSYALLA